MIINRRIILILISFLMFVLMILLLNFKSIGRRPELLSISNSVLSPGERITLYGNYFGGVISREQVIINNKMLFKDFIESWSENEIILRLPNDFRSGMIVVKNMFGESNPYLVTSTNDVPTIISNEAMIGKPFIESGGYIEESDIEIVINGRGFSSNYSNSELYIIGVKEESIKIDNSSISLWSDDKIKFSIPFSINNLVINVVAHGKYSNDFTIHNTQIPRIIYNKSKGRILEITQTLEVKDIIAIDQSFIDLYIPVPFSDYNQITELVSNDRKEVIKGNNIVRKILKPNISGLNYSVEVVSKVELHQIDISLRKENISSNYSKNNPEYKSGFLKTPNIPILDNNISSTGKWIVRNSRNRYSQVELILDWLVRNIVIEEGQIDDATIAFVNKKTTNFGFVNLTVAMLRSVGIPSRIVRGVKIDGKNEQYQWLEFYLPNSGWVPLDAILAKDDSNYNIGSLMNNRLGFSKGVLEIPYKDENYQDNFYSLLNCTSNSEGNIEKYNVIWHNIIVK